VSAEARFPGVNFTPDEELEWCEGFMTGTRNLIEDRRSVLAGLFTTNEQSLDHMLALERPVALLGRMSAATLSVLDWLSQQGKGSPVYRGDGMVLWLMQPARDKL
jgi:hypothetical protein